MDTITAGDYTVLHKISEEEFIKFQSVFVGKKENLVYSYMNSLKAKFEPIIND